MDVVDRIYEEFNALIVNSMNCFYCFKESKDRSVAVLEFDEGDLWLIEPYTTMAVPVCLECHKMYNDGNMDRQRLADSILKAMDEFPYQILNKEFQDGNLTKIE